MHRATRLLYPRPPSLLPRLQPRKGRQERRMNIDHRPSKLFQKRCLHHPHVPRQHHQIRPRLPQLVGQLPLDLRLQMSSVLSLRTNPRPHSPLFRLIQNFCVRLITPHQNKIRRHLARLHRLRQSDKVTPPTRPQHAQPQSPHVFNFCKTAVVDRPGVRGKISTRPPPSFTTFTSSASSCPSS